MTLEELSVVFSADVAPFAQAVSQVSGLISVAASQADGMADHFTAAGTQAGDGLRIGLLSRRSAVAQAAQALAQAAASALRGALAIHSPSRVTQQMGALFDEGLLQGIAGSANRVEREAASLGSRTAAALQFPDVPVPVPAAAPSAAAPAGEAALPPISLTIPLEIDGYRLGVAAIEGINRVSHGTGRVELTL